MARRSLFVALVLTIVSNVPAQAQWQPDPLTAGASFNYGLIKDFVTRSAAEMPAEHYAFRPTPQVRTFAQLIGHLADANYRLCAVAAGEGLLRQGVEATETTTAGLAEVLADSFAYCDKVYANMTDAVGAAIVGLEVGGEARIPIELPKLSVLAFHTQHAFEHYGNIVTYMRINGLVPPSSAPRPGP